MNKKKNKPTFSSTIRPLAALTQLGLNVMSPIGMGIFFGFMFDEWRGTSPWGVAAGIVIGIGAGYKAAYNMMKRYMRKPDDDEN
ncbi:MAG: AtpZ/AtpI family protein [Anaerofustis stercorihominis]|nr:AtpZ/AtpI family protein [Anaerofustis stercorihominis]